MDTTLSSLLARLQTGLTSARKAQDKARTLVLSTVLADVKNRRIDLMRDLNDDEVAEVLRRGIKRRRESIEIYESAKRQDLAEKEGAEVRVLETYLPPSVDAEEIRSAVQAAIASGATTIGAVMGRVLPQFKGRAEGSTINALAREELGKRG